MDDMISRQAAVEVMRKAKDKSEAHRMLIQLPSAQPVNIAKLQPNCNQVASDCASDCISRQAAIEAIQKLNIPEDMCVFEIMSHIEVEIATLPTVQPQRMKGAWINDGRIIRCNKCKTGYAAVKGMKSALTYDFCPNCGADMRCSENPNS